MSLKKDTGSDRSRDFAHYILFLQDARWLFLTRLSYLGKQSDVNLD